MALYSNAFSQYLDGNGDPLPGSKLDFFENGTTTPKDTFTTAALTVSNSNPVITDSDGRVPAIFLDGVYTARLSTAADVIIATQDNVGETVEGQLELWQNDQTYSIPELVTGSDDRFYRSLTDSNQGNDPTTSATNWEEIEFERIFNTNVTYSIGDRSIGSDGKIYLSLTNSNLGNDPTGDIVNWGPAITNFPTQSSGNSTTLAATTAFVDTEIVPTENDIAVLIPSNAADADHDITISTGKARDSAGAKTLALSSAITKQIDATWVVGSDMGGLFSGTVAADTTYHFFIIEQDSDGLIDAGFDTSLTAANIPTGYTAFRRVFSILTDSSSNILAFDAFETEGGLYIDLDSKIADINTAALGTTVTNLTMTVPQDIQVLVHFSAHIVQSAVGQVLIFTSSHQADQAVTTANADMSTAAVSSRSVADFFRITDTSGRIRYRSSVSAVTSFDVQTIGWIDYRR